MRYTFYDDTKAAHCLAYGPGLCDGQYGFPMRFVIQAKDTKHQRRTSGTDEFNVSVVDEKGEAGPMHVTVTDHENGLYTVEYIAPKEGTFHVHVTMAGAHIRGSPFLVTFSNPWVQQRTKGSAPPVLEPEKQSHCRLPGGQLMHYVVEPKDGDDEIALAVLDMSSMAWETPPMKERPPLRDGATTTGLDDKVVVFGGYNSSKGEATDSVYMLAKDRRARPPHWKWMEPGVTLAVSGPSASPRSFHAAALIGKNVIVVSGGKEMGGDQLDVNLLSVEGNSSVVWLSPMLKNPEMAPISRHKHSMVCSGLRVFVFGGLRNKPPEEEAAASPIVAPVQDEGAEDDELEEGEKPAATDAAPSRMSMLLNDLAILHIKETIVRWEIPEANGDLPTPRRNAKMEVVDNNLVMVYGGFGDDDVALDDYYIYDLTEKHWRCVYSRSAFPSEVSTNTIFDAETKQIFVVRSDSGQWDEVEVLDMDGALVQTDIVEENSRLLVKQLAQLETFVDSKGSKMDTPVEEDMLGPLLRVMESLHDILSQSDSTDLLIDSMVESSIFLVQNGQDVDDLNDRLENIKGKWQDVKKRAPKIKSNIRQYQDREGRKIKHEIERFAENMDTFREDFKAEGFYLFKTGSGEAFRLIQQMHVELANKTVELNEKEKLALLFECAELVEKPRSVQTACREDLKLAKILWDCVMMVSSYFHDWKAVKWDDIDTDKMEDQVKKFKAVIRAMPKQIRQEFEAYEQLRDMTNDMGAALPVIGDLHQECMRPRHWDRVVELTKAPLNTSAISDLTFEDMLKLKLHEFVDDVGEVVDRAQKEEKIERNLAMLDGASPTLFCSNSYHIGVPNA